MRNDASHDRGVQLPLEIQVIDELPATAQKAQIFNSLNWTADEGISASHSSLLKRFENPQASWRISHFRGVCRFLGCELDRPPPPLARKQLHEVVLSRRGGAGVIAHIFIEA